MSGLTDLLMHDLRPVRADTVMLELGPRGAAAFEDRPVAMLHVVLAGSVVCEAAESAPAILGEGDVALLLSGRRHQVRAAEAGAARAKAATVTIGETLGELPEAPPV